MKEDPIEGRRPLNVRKRQWPNRVAEKLVQYGVRPNQISVASVGFALACGLCVVGASLTEQVFSAVLLIVAAASIQMRLICNLLDGIVAVEGGMGTPSGELFNDIPDRIADPLILVSAGYGAANFVAGQELPIWLETGSVTLGWVAGLLAVMTAYIRVLAVSIGSPPNFMGPMAKQHRMALMTAAYLIASILIVAFSLRQVAGLVIALGLFIISLGCMLTCVRRARFARVHLDSTSHEGNDAL